MVSAVSIGMGGILIDVKFHFDVVFVDIGMDRYNGSSLWSFDVVN
jgi:hypothetical protein